jgi:hypothetical protein
MKKVLTVCKYSLGLILQVPTILVFELWIKAFNEGSTPQERVQIFLSFFPQGTTRDILSWGPIALSLAGVVLAGLFLIKSTTAQRVVNVIVIIFGLAITFLNILWQIFQRL